MKIIKLCAFLMLVASLNATEVEPFDKFLFGDTFTPVYEKLCSIKEIETIKIGFTDSMTKNNFCASKENAIKFLKPHLLDFISKVNIEGFENIAKGTIYIKANGVSVKNVDFELVFQLGTFTDDEAVGSYLLTKNDIFMINGLYVPLELVKLELRPQDNSRQLAIYQKEIFDILWKKYEYLANKNSAEHYKKMNFLKISGNDGTSLSFDSSGIIYDASVYLNKLRKQAFNLYITNLPKSKKDASGAL